MKLKGWLILGGVVTIFAGLGYWIKKQIDKMNDYDYDLKKIKIKTLSRDKLILTITYLFKNPSDIYIDVDAIILNIRLNGKFIGQVRQNFTQRIKPNSESSFDIDADVTLKNIIKPLELAQLINFYLTDKSKLVFSFNGSAVVRHSFIRVNVPIEDLNYKLTELI